MTDSRKCRSLCTPTGCRYVNRVTTGPNRNRYTCYVCGGLRPLRSKGKV